jgi:hypothetical protein
LCGVRGSSNRSVASKKPFQCKGEPCLQAPPPITSQPRQVPNRPSTPRPDSKLKTNPSQNRGAPNRPSPITTTVHQRVSASKPEHICAAEVCNDEYYLSDGETGFVTPHARLVCPDERRSLREKRVPYSPPCALSGLANGHQEYEPVGKIFEPTRPCTGPVAALGHDQSCVPAATDYNPLLNRIFSRVVRVSSATPRT